MTFEEFAASLALALRDVHLDAIVVGNIAAALQHAPVVTQDIDFLIRSTPLNEKKLRKLAAAIGGTAPAPISEMTSAVRIHGAYMQLDFLFGRIAGGLTFASVKSRAKRIPVGKGSLTVAHLRDVIRSKEAAGRPKDRAVLPILRDTLAVNEKLER